MAEDNLRVHKASEVHKRRAVKNARPEVPAASAPSDAFEVQSDAEQRQSDEPTASSDSSVPAEPLPEEPAETKAPKRKRWGLRIAVAIACVVAAAMLVSAGFVAGSRWLRYNDAHDIEGTWYVSGTDTSIAFADGAIALNSDTAYQYEVDSTAKTITYSLGDLSGQGRYWFNDDRSILIITDGSDFTMWSTLADDLAYSVRRLFGEDGLPTGEDSIVLTKVITLTRESEPEAPRDADAQETGDRSGSGSESESESTGKRDEFSGLTISDVLLREDGEGEEATQE